MNAKHLQFTNICGSSLNVFYAGQMIAHFCSNGGPIQDPLQPDSLYSGFTFEWATGVDKRSIPFTEKQIVDRFVSERKRLWNAEVIKMNTGWVQWVNMEYEDNRADKLNEALKSHGLKVVFEHIGDGADTDWFRIVKA